MTVDELIPPTVTSVNRLPAVWPGQPEYQQAVTDSNPLAFYGFGEGAGTTLVDATGNHLDGTYGAGTAPGAQGVYGPAREAAASFDGTGYLSVSAPSLDLTHDVSFS